MQVGRPGIRTWSVALVVGLVAALGGVLVGALPAGAVDTRGLVCNNQKGRADQDCVGSNAHGTITATRTADGLRLVLRAADGFRGWNQFYLCLGTSAPTQSADCQGNTPTVRSPLSDYDVVAPTPNAEHDKDVSFACSPTVEAFVPAAVLTAAGSDGWTVHVNTCSGGTDEAFGATAAPSGEGAKHYACAEPTGVTSSAATLRATTDDASVDAVSFALTPAAGGDAAGQPSSTTWTAAVTGLAPSTSYAITATFRSGGTVVGTASGAGCGFATDAVGERSAEVAGIVLTRPGDGGGAAVAAVAGATEAPASVAGASVAAEAMAVEGAAAAPGELPATGADTGVLAPIGLGLVVVGALALGYGSLRRPEGAHYVA